MQWAIPFRYVRGGGFQPADYGEEVARILELDGGGKRPMTLVRLTAQETSSRIQKSVVGRPILAAAVFQAAEPAGKWVRRQDCLRVQLIVRGRGR
jgi:hypothetical protein